MLEKELQLQVVTALSALGYTVLETGKARSKNKCVKCGHSSYATGWQGNSAGLPDLYIHNTAWQLPIGVGIELKTTKGAVRLKQQEFADMHITNICRSLNDVLANLQKIEALIGTDKSQSKLDRFISNEWRTGY